MNKRASFSLFSRVVCNFSRPGSSPYSANSTKFATGYLLGTSIFEKFEGIKVGIMLIRMKKGSGQPERLFALF